MRFMGLSGKIRAFVWLVVISGILIWLVGGGNLSLFSKMLKGDQKDVLKAENFKFTEVSRKDIHQKVLATGTLSLKTGAEVKIGARISGQLERLMVKIGDRVQAGDLIAVIEHEDLLARVARFEADLRAEEARLEKARMEGPLEIRKDKASVEELNVQLRMAEKTLKRNLDLSQKGFVSASAVDEAEEKAEVLKAKIKLAQEELNLQAVKLDNDIRLAEAGVAKAEANLREERTQLSYADVTATIDGVVAFISTQEGETVIASLNAPTFVTLIDMSRMEVTVFVDETDIGRIKTNQKAVFTVDAYADKFFAGTVREIHPKAVIKDNVVNYEVILEIDPKNISLLRPEMTANVVVTTDTRKNVLTIPKEAVKKSGKKSFAIVKLNDKVIEEPIATGWRDGGFIEVVSGLKEKDQVGVPIKPKGDKRRGKRPRRR
jgi:HlyD family secretion protein